MAKGKTYILYRHTNKKNGKAYFGITRQKPERRWQNGHGYDGTYFGNAIKKYGWDGFTHEVIAVGLTKEEACDLEQKYIAEYKTDNRDSGYNISKGGETCDVIKGKVGIDHPNHTRVKMIDPNTHEVIRIFGAQSEAARVMGIERRGITKACQGINQTYMGYIWEYADREYEKPQHHGVGNYPHVKHQKRVILIETDGSIHEFESQIKAAEYAGIKKNMVSQYLNGYCKDRTGRRWCHA